MAKARILIVEDERIIAEDIRKSLQALQYTVEAVTATGEEAVTKADERRPDLVLMDILLAGKMNGIQAARQIHDQFHIPIIFLTANANQAMVEEAKKAEPYGYILKPFQDQELESVIEMACYKHAIEDRLRESQAWLTTMLRSMACAVVAADNNGNITFLNQQAEKITGWESGAALGRPVAQVVNLSDQAVRGQPMDIFDCLLRDQENINLANTTILVNRRGTAIPIAGSGAPIKDDTGQRFGLVLIFHDSSDRNKPKTDDRRITEDRGRTADDGRPKTNDRRPMTDYGPQKTEDRRSK
jgi:PAS domain S-box-containing protein